MHRYTRTYTHHRAITKWLFDKASAVLQTISCDIVNLYILWSIRTGGLQWDQRGIRNTSGGRIRLCILVLFPKTNVFFLSIKQMHHFHKPLSPMYQTMMSLPQMTRLCLQNKKNIRASVGFILFLQQGCFKGDLKWNPLLYNSLFPLTDVQHVLKRYHILICI